MRKPLLAFVIVLATVASLALAGQASAACSTPASTYSSGGTPGGSFPNDPLFSHQWGLTQIDAPSAWGRGDRGAGVTIAIVDTGIDLTHPDLAAHLVPGADLDRGVSTTDGGAGAPPGGACPGPQDENGHGTHVAGIAAAITNNGIGVAGTAPDASLMPVRVLDASGAGQDQAVLDGIHYAADHGAKVINLSLGGAPVVGELPSQDFQNAVNDAYSKGAVVVAAAGNESIPLCSQPAGSQNAVCVGATDSRGMPAAYSNFPASPGGNVGVRAPGGSGAGIVLGCEQDEDVWSTIWPGDTLDDCPAPTNITGYDTMAGTSMATPFVSGLAAILAGKGLSAPQILECLRTTSTNHGSYDPANGYGIIDAGAATATCSAATTPAFRAGSSSSRSGGGSGSRDFLVVRIKRSSLAKAGTKRKLTVLISSSRARRVSLHAVARRGHKKARGLARRVVTLKKAGTKTVTLKLSRRGAHLLRKRGTHAQVTYKSGKLKGTASPY